MRKALIPMLASLVLCGGATAALIVNARAAPTNARKPMMIALVAPGTMLAQNSAAPPVTREMRMPAEMTARLKQMCEDRYAREAGRVAYLEARLKLTSTQQPLFARWKEAALDIARRRGADCSQRVTQRDRKEEMLKRRIADLDAERPALSALYGALSPEQRESLSPGRRGMMAGGMMMDRERFQRPPMEMGDHPPPSPPQ
jgi:hypothetical protein